MADEPSIRLNKFLAQHLNIGRRAADDLIADGKVFINGAKADLGRRISPGDAVKADNIIINSAKPPVFLYVLLNKPVDYVCSRRKQGSIDTIYSLLPAKYQHLKAVGRLDKNSSGLLLLTNDGDLAHRFLHPSFIKIKEYNVTIDQPLTDEHKKQIAVTGIELPDGLSKLGLEQNGANKTCWKVTMHQGRNRQIRRTFAALGYAVIKLNRTKFGPLDIKSLHGKQFLEISKPSNQ